ncbi:MAG: hypothetical protein KatS3mg103_1215 [Phycisphaerales bacterium]|nr:MAG: hypothetical protein KatS3mg103_1215 [Phycisphaerales bacterium]
MAWGVAWPRVQGHAAVDGVLHGGDDRRAGGALLEGSPTGGCLRIDDQVADLGGQALHAQEHPPVEHGAAADARADPDRQGVALVACGSQALLGQGRGVDVVDEHHRRALGRPARLGVLRGDRLADHLGQGHVLPAQVDRRREPAQRAGRIDHHRPGHAQPDRSRRAEAQVRAQRARGLGDGLGGLARVLGRGLLVPGQDPAGGIDHAHAQARGAQVHADHREPDGLVRAGAESRWVWGHRQGGLGLGGGPPGRAWARWPACGAFRRAWFARACILGRPGGGPGQRASSRCRSGAPAGSRPAPGVVAARPGPGRASRRAAAGR